jgi:hypothetical protein
MSEKEMEAGKAVERQEQSKKERQQRQQQKTHKIHIKNLDAWFGTKQTLKNINLDIKY